MMAACWFAMREGRRHRGRDDAAAAREGAAPTSSTKARGVAALCDARLADELDRARPGCPTLRRVAMFETTRTRARSAAAAATPATFDDLRHRRRRHRADRVHVGHHRRAEGHDALPSRRDRGMRLLAQDARSRRPPTTSSPAAPPLAFTFGLGGLLCFPLRIGACDGAARAAVARSAARGDRGAPAPPCSFTAPTSYRAMALADAQARPRRACARASRRARRCRPRRASSGRTRPASRSSTASARPRCSTSSSRTATTTCDPARPASRCPATARASWTTTGGRCPPARSAASRSRDRPAAATSTIRARRTTCRTAGT